MKGSTRAAVALGVGYVLGRHRKLRTATVMAVATAAGSTTLGSTILRKGTKYLGSTDAIGKLAPQAGEIVDVVRGDLISAGKAAATAAVSNKVDALTGSLHERAERIRNPGEAIGEAGEAVSGAGRAAGRTVRRAGSRGKTTLRGDEADDTDDYADDEQGDLEDEEPDEAAPRRGGRGRSPVARARSRR